jgi:hypothetical protein
MRNFSSAISYLQKGSLQINKDYIDFLQTKNLSSFEDIWKHEEEQIIKDIKPRSVSRLSFPETPDEQTLFIKKHKRQFIGLRGIIQRCRGKRGISQGPLEFENICEFRKNGLNTVIPIAAGERFLSIFWVESLLITQNFFPYESLESLQEKKPDFFSGSKGKERKNALVKKISTLAQKMHSSGFHHRDFNATHILLYYDKDSESIDPHIALFDLQRIEKKKYFHLRWRIKCLARLNYSLSDKIFTKQDRVRTLLLYNGKQRVGFIEKMQWYWIQKKTAQIKKHTKKKHNLNKGMKT